MRSKRRTYTFCSKTCAVLRRRRICNGRFVPVGTKETIRGSFNNFPDYFYERGSCYIAIYHLSIKIISRGKGKSAVAAAAYRAAEKITNEYNGITSDYTKKCGVIHTEIQLPDNAPKEYTDRSVMWNSVEKFERYKTAQLAREIEVALPRELTESQNIRLVREYVKNNFVKHGMCADFAIHDKGDGNPHAHIMLTMRHIEPDGQWGQKSRTVDGIKINAVDWNNKGKSEEWRASWSETVNEFLEHGNHVDRVDHRSFKRQGKEELPTIHLGVAASQMEQKGIRTERGNINREIAVMNNQLRQLKARLNKLSNWVEEEAKNPVPPTLYDIVSDILNQKSVNQSNFYNLKAAASMLVFLQDNNIRDIADLENKVDSMHGRISELRENLKPVERRLKTLDEHIKQGEIYKKHRGIAKDYNALYADYETANKSTGIFAKRKAEKALEFANNFYRSHESEMILYESAERYIKEIMQKRYDPKKLPPITKWKAERETLTAERNLIYREFNSLKDEVKEVEKVKRSVCEVVREDRRRERPQKAKEEYGLE